MNNRIFKWAKLRNYYLIIRHSQSKIINPELRWIRLPSHFSLIIVNYLDCDVTFPWLFRQSNRRNGVFDWFITAADAARIVVLLPGLMCQFPNSKGLCFPFFTIIWRNSCIGISALVTFNGNRSYGPLNYYNSQLCLVCKRCSRTKKLPRY